MSSTSTSVGLAGYVCVQRIMALPQKHCWQSTPRKQPLEPKFLTLGQECLKKPVARPQNTVQVIVLAASVSTQTRPSSQAS